uniref:Aminotransferase-like plant mobile domain-containing protein n=1 Tax=Fagus sylvatica TaxID=28930 RepID=A0A2N9FGB0_FAGSY
MASSSSTIPVGPPLQPSAGKGLEALVDGTSGVHRGNGGNPRRQLPPPSLGEAEDLREGFAYPLIDPWYSSSPLFPPRSVDFSFPMEDWDWTVSGLEPTATPINFDFLCAASKDWSHWVDREILDPDFWDRLVDAGVHWSILISRSCNMFRDTESLRELLRRWCPSTHTFFFSWGELTPTLEDVANHWMLPILGEYSLSNIKLSAAEEETAAALRKRSSTRLSGWPSFFVHQKDASVRRAAFVLYWLCKCTFGNFPCYSVNIAFIPLAIRISAGHCFPLAPLFLGHLYSQLDLLHDCEIQGDSCYILSAAFNTSALQTFFWEHSVSYAFAARDKSAAWSRFSDLPREFLEHFPDFRDNLPLVYRWVGLKTHDHDLVDALDYEENVLFRPYGDDHPGFTCASIFRKFYRPSPLIRDLKVDDYRSLSYLSTVNPGFLPILSATGVSFIPYCPQRVQRQFGLDQGETTRVLIPGGHRLGFNTPSMGAYLAAIHSIHGGICDRCQRRLDCLYHTSARGLEELLLMLWRTDLSCSRSVAREARERLPVDQAIEKTSKKPAPSVPSSKKAPSKKTKAGKKSKSPLLVPSAVKESTTVLTEEPAKSTAAPSKKTKAGKEGKSTPLVPSAAKESTTVPTEEPAKSTVAPSKLKSASASPSKKSTPSPSKKKKFVAPQFPLGAASRTRSKSGPKVTRASGRSGGGVVEVEVISSLFSLVTSDVADDDVIASPLKKGAPQTAAVDQDEELRKSVADSSEVGAESTGEDHSSSSGSFFDSAPDSVPEEEIVSAGSTADDDDMPEADDSNAVDADADPISFAVPQTVLTGRLTGMPYSFLISLSSADEEHTQRTSYILRTDLPQPVTLPVRLLPLLDGALMLEGTHAQGFVESESVVDLGVGTADRDVPAEGAGASAVDILAGSDHLGKHRLGCRLMKYFVPIDLVIALMVDFYFPRLGMDDTVHVSEDVGEVGITGEVTAVSPPPRPTIEAEFDAKAPNPHPEQYFWSFNGPLVPFGDFWVPNDCSPYLSRLSAGHGDFTKGFKLSIGLGGPMLSLLGSVLAAMNESSLEDVTTTRILAWRSVIQDLMDVGFDLGFMIERLRQTAQCLFGKRLADEIKALQHQIALLQDSLAELTAYQDEMMSTGRMVPRSGRGGSFLDSLLD